jgi:hypothetical protein
MMQGTNNPLLLRKLKAQSRPQGSFLSFPFHPSKLVAVVRGCAHQVAGWWCALLTVVVWWRQSRERRSRTICRGRGPRWTRSTRS